MKIPSILAGVSGEYFVAAELSRRGYVASISLRNTRGIDILATNQDATRSITIQVKTSQLTRATWVLTEKAETISSERHFYVFVILGEPDARPSFYIVPSKVVAVQIRDDHSAWTNTPGKRGQPHGDSVVRKFSDPEGKFREKWELLGL